MRRIFLASLVKVAPDSNNKQSDESSSVLHEEGLQIPMNLSTTTAIDDGRSIDIVNSSSSTVLPMDNDPDTHARHENLSTSCVIRNEEPIFDCILVYTKESITEPTLNAEQPSMIQRLIRAILFAPYSKSAKDIIRMKFQEQLKNKYQFDIHEEEGKEIISTNPIFRLCCRKQTSKKFVYVKIRAPFHALLYSAENVRMKLPIEEMNDAKKKNVSTQTKNKLQRINFRRCKRFISWIKRLFNHQNSSTINQHSYRTIVYSSSNINQFIKFFGKRNRSKGDVNCSSDENLLNIAEKNYFTFTERHWLTCELLSRVADTITLEGRPESLNSYKYFGIHQLISDGIYDSCFPLHEKIDDESTDRNKLSKCWANWRRFFKPQPLDMVRSYMGEKVAFYFAALGFYTIALIPPSIVGTIIFIYGVINGESHKAVSDICESFGEETVMCPLCDETCPFWVLSDSCIYAGVSYIFDNTATVVFAILMSIWSRGFVEWWKRHQSELQYRWDSIDFYECNEPIRPDFEKHVKSMEINPRTGRSEPHITIRERLPKFLISITVILIMIIVVCLTIFATSVYRIQAAYILETILDSSYTSITITVTSAVINLICSMILSKLYYSIARKLTDAELHKYSSNYEAAFSIKVYIFEFFNYYSSLFYIAYFKGRSDAYPSTYGPKRSTDFDEQCNPAGCMVELSIQLFIIMFGKQTINNVFEYGPPIISSLRKNKENREQWVIDNESKKFDWQTLFPEYLEIIIQFGFVTLFVAAFPLAPLFALLNNIIELRLDAWKLLTKHRRPVVYKAANIGIWGDILSMVSYLAVITNAAVIAWTSDFIPKLAYEITEGTGTGLDDYVNWTLSSFPISDYRETGTMNPDVPEDLVYCRYRDFRESTGPNYEYTITFWHIIAYRLAFMIVFENIIYLIVYLVQLIVPDIPSHIQKGIDRQRYAEQHHGIPPPNDPSELKTKLESAVNNQTIEDSTNNSSSKEYCDQGTSIYSDIIDVN